jgi:hypothetical protein
VEVVAAVAAETLFEAVRAVAAVEALCAVAVEGTLFEAVVIASCVVVVTAAATACAAAVAATSFAAVAIASLAAVVAEVLGPSAATASDRQVASAMPVPQKFANLFLRAVLAGNRTTQVA